MRLESKWVFFETSDLRLLSDDLMKARSFRLRKVTDRCMRYDLKWVWITRAAASRREFGCGKWWLLRRRRVVSRAAMRWIREVTVGLSVIDSCWGRFVW